MNTRTLISALVVVSLNFAAHAAPAARSEPYAFVVDRVERANDTVEIGDSRNHVMRTIGHPSSASSEYLWIYKNRFQAQTENPDHGCTTLLVRFDERHVVTELKLVNDSASALIAKLDKAGKAVCYRPDEMAIAVGDANRLPTAAASTDK